MSQILPQSVEEMTDIIGIEGILHLPWVRMVPFMVWGLLAVILLAVLVVLGLRILKKWGGKVEQRLTPVERARLALALFKKKNLQEKQEWRLFYFELDTILRRFIFEEFAYDVLDKTHAEILRAFEQIATDHPVCQTMGGQGVKKLKAFWDSVQLIKFAKCPSTPEACEQDFGFVEAFIGKSVEVKQVLTC